MGLYIAIIKFRTAKNIFKYIYTPGKKYKTTFKKEEKKYCLQLLNYENQINER